MVRKITIKEFINILESIQEDFFYFSHWHYKNISPQARGLIIGINKDIESLIIELERGE